MAARHSIHFNNSSSMAMIFGVTPSTSYSRFISHETHKKDQPAVHLPTTAQDAPGSSDKKAIDLGAYHAITATHFSRCHNTKNYSKTELDVSAYNYNESIKLKTLKPRVKHPTIIPHKLFTFNEKKDLLNDTLTHNSQLIAEKQKKEQQEKNEKLMMKTTIDEHVSLIVK